MNKIKKRKFYIQILCLEKFNLPSGTLLSAESLTNKLKQTVNFSNISKHPFPLTPSKKSIMIQEFKDKLKLLIKKCLMR